MNKESCINSLKKRFSDMQLDESVFDWNAEYSEDITPDENFTILSGKVDLLIGKSIKEIVKAQKEQEQSVKTQQQTYYEKWTQEHKKRLVDLFDKPKIIGIVGNIHTGKSNLLYHLITELRKEGTFNLITYGLRNDLPYSHEIFSVKEMEKLKNSVLIIDEMISLWDLDNRMAKRSIEETLRLIAHNNNIVVICGTCENFKKFISSKLDVVIYKECNIMDFINGSSVKRILMDYHGVERGTDVLSLEKNEIVMYNGKHYYKMDIPYYPEFDTKKDNEEIVKKIVKQSVNQSVTK